jgi:hypothetical protein
MTTDVPPLVNRTMLEKLFHELEQLDRVANREEPPNLTELRARIGRAVTLAAATLDLEDDQP